MKKVLERHVPTVLKQYSGHVYARFVFKDDKNNQFYRFCYVCPFSRFGEQHFHCSRTESNFAQFFCSRTEFLDNWDARNWNSTLPKFNYKFVNVERKSFITNNYHGPLNFVKNNFYCICKSFSYLCSRVLNFFEFAIGKFILKQIIHFY